MDHRAGLELRAEAIVAAHLHPGIIPAALPNYLKAGFRPVPAERSAGSFEVVPRIMERP